ncbi:MAG: hypothetical protein FJY97_04345 [candidate division Zixibacteria bacterium]|nr:hypothetical protein [candidate division Zixibacteria bacterium]
MNRPKICLTDSAIAKENENALQNLGWQIVSVDAGLIKKQLPEAYWQWLNHLAKHVKGPGYTGFLKIYAWALPFQKCVFLDADTLVVNPLDPLFAFGELAAVRDYPVFNSGVMTFCPNRNTYDLLITNLEKMWLLFSQDYIGCPWRDSDQIYLSRMFEQVYVELAPQYNDMGRQSCNSIIVHFNSEPKPWVYDFTSDIFKWIPFYHRYGFRRSGAFLKFWRGMSQKEREIYKTLT